MLLDESSSDVSPPELLDGECTAKELDIGGYADDRIVREGFVECFDGPCSAWSVNNQLGNHGVIISSDFIALTHC